MKKLNIWLLLTTLLCSTLFTACNNYDDPVATPKPHHTEATEALIRICNNNAEVKSLLEHAIAQAAEINPDRRYNPAQSLNEFYDFIDWNVRQLPWDVMIHQAPSNYGRSLYGRTDQGIGYFWFIVDQPLDELRDRGFFYPTVEFVEPFASWLSTYSNCWGDFLSTEATWNDPYYNIVKDDPY